jgi:hypothetical protein
VLLFDAASRRAVGFSGGVLLISIAKWRDLNQAIPLFLVVCGGIRV